MKMIELLDSQAKSYLTGLNLRSVQVDALNKLLTKSYQTDAKQALNDSKFTDSMLSARQLHSLVVNQAAGWILDILDGTWTPCPVPPQAGLNQAAPIRWFRENGQSVAENISTKKAIKAKQKADAKAANKPEKEDAPETFTAQDIEAAKAEGKAQARKEAYAVSAADISPDMILQLIDALDRQDRHRVLAALAAKYPTQAPTRKGKGAGNQANLPV